MSDLISRKGAIDYIKTQRGRPFIGITLEEAIIMMIEEVPSAEKTQLSGEDATSVCKCPCEYREPCDYCHYDAYRGHGCPAEEGLKDE